MSDETHHGAASPPMGIENMPPCRCGHTAVWHRWDGSPEGGPPYGPCEITGPWPQDGCDCRRYTPGEAPRS